MEASREQLKIGIGINEDIAKQIDEVINSDQGHDNNMWNNFQVGY